jgi:hypothetical protein
MRCGQKQEVVMVAPKSWRIIGLVVLLTLALCPVTWAQAPEAEVKGPFKAGPNPMNVVTDILILRPVGLVMIPVTAIIYVIGYPFAKTSGSDAEAYQSLVGNTIEYTFKRPLGGGEPFE